MATVRPSRKQLWDDWLPPDPGRHVPELVPIFGVKAFGADSTCEDIHPGGPIPGGSLCCCMRCHKSGVEHRVRDHRKPDDGRLREGWDVPQPTKYVPPQVTTAKGRRLRGGIGR